MTTQSVDQFGCAKQPASCPALNHDELLNRCMGNVALAERILDRFSTEFPERLSELQSLVESGDAEEMARLTHQLKGTASNVSASRMQSCLARLHEETKQSHWDDAQRLVDQLAEEFEGVQLERTQLAQTSASDPSLSENER